MLRWMTQKFGRRRMALALRATVWMLTAGLLMSATRDAHAVILAAWETNGLTSYGPNPFVATTLDANVTAGGLTRAAGIGTGGSAAGNTWGGTSFVVGGTTANAVANSEFMTFSLTANAGSSISLSSITSNMRRSSTGPNTFQWQFDIGSGFTNIGAAFSFTDTNTNGVAQAPVDLSGIAALQNVAAGTPVTMRLLIAGASGATGTWGFGRLSGNDLVVNGNVSGVVIDPPPPPPPPPTPTGNIIAQQAFDIIASAYPGNPTTNTVDEFPAGSSNNPITNIGASYNGTSPTINGGMTFQTLWTDTRGNQGPLARDIGSDTSDFIGVNSFAGAGNPDVSPDGTPVAAFSQYNYEFNDLDGRADLIFDPVDVTGLTDVNLELFFWVASTGFEAGDSLLITLLDNAGHSASLLNLDAAGLSANTAANETDAASWKQVVFNLQGSGLTGNFLTLRITVDNNAADENIFVDSITFRGTPSVGGAADAPEPGSLTLLGLAALGLFRRRWAQREV